LKWELDAKDKEFSIQAAIAKGRELPEWALNEPPLYPGDDFFITAFYELSTGEPIPWIDRMTYARHKCLEPDVADAFSHIIRGMDSEYMKWKAAKEKALNAGKNNGKLQNRHSR
jgi:hypothetical protein